MTVTISTETCAFDGGQLDVTTVSRGRVVARHFVCTTCGSPGAYFAVPVDSSEAADFPTADDLASWAALRFDENPEPR